MTWCPHFYRSAKGRWKHKSEKKTIRLNAAFAVLWLMSRGNIITPHPDNRSPHTGCLLLMSWCLIKTPWDLWKQYWMYYAFMIFILCIVLAEVDVQNPCGCVWFGDSSPFASTHSLLLVSSLKATTYKLKSCEIPYDNEGGRDWLWLFRWSLKRSSLLPILKVLVHFFILLSGFLHISEQKPKRVHLKYDHEKVEFELKSGEKNIHLLKRVLRFYVVTIKAFPCK